MMVLSLSDSIDRSGKAAQAPARALNAQTIQEWDLVQRAQQMDASALTWLYQVYHPKVYNYAHLQLGETHLAEDVASDVMVKLLESLKGFRFRGVPFAAWVFRIARNHIIDVKRRRRRRGEVRFQDNIAASPHDNATRAEWVLDRHQLQVALRRLTEEQRQVIVLKFMEGFDNATAAKVLGRSEGAIKSLQHRALASLRRILTEGGA
jgi:RNA polymerase sigma-70 factor (ECF subfamily)